MVGCIGMIIWPMFFGDSRSLVPAFVVLVVWGGLTGGFYTVGLAQLGARFRGSDLASANAMFVLLYSVGSMTVTPCSGRIHAGPWSKRPAPVSGGYVRALCHPGGMAAGEPP
jgi:hypothetical protein